MGNEFTLKDCSAEGTYAATNIMGFFGAVPFYL